MTQKFNSRVSAEGALLIADAVAKNTKMSFLKAYGSTTEFSDDQLAGLTDKDLTGASHNQTGHISNVSVDDATSTVHTEIVLDGNTVEADYGLNSILMVATVDGNEHLFAVLKANQVQYMNAYDGKSSTNLQINCSFKVSNTDVVDIIKVDTAGTLTRADYDKLHEFTVSQVAVTVTNVNKYTDTAMSKEAAARSAADSAENKARSDADTWETGQRTAADTTETNARIAADNAAASSVSKLTSTVAANYTSATVYADSAVAKEAAARSSASTAASSATVAEAAARSTADSNEAKARSNGDSSEANARSAADKTLTDSITKVSDKLDNTVVHNSGDETVAGIKNFTGTLQANGKQVATYDQINPWHIINGAGHDLNNVIDDGRYWLAGIMTNSPVANWAYLYVNAVGPTRVQQECVDDTKGNMYIRIRNDATWSEWKQVTFW